MINFVVSLIFVTTGYSSVVLTKHKENSRYLIDAHFWDLSTNESDIKIYFYSQKHIDAAMEIHHSDYINSVGKTDFDYTKPTVFTVHGWHNQVESPFCQEVKNAYLKVQDVNVFVIDWNSIARYMYFLAYAAVPKVGNVLGKLIQSMVAHNKLYLNNTIIVGHSLGAHVAGLAGAALGGQIDTIIGLDAAWPFFSINNTEERLDRTDAKFVQSVHTCAGILGFPVPIGHVDYFANDGRWQPGCHFDLIVVTEHHEVSSDYYYDRPYIMTVSLPGLYIKRNLFGPLQHLHVNESDIKIVFYSQSNSVFGTRLRIYDTELTAYTNFDEHKDTVFLIHGWRNHMYSQFCIRIKEALFATKDINLFVVDWSKLSQFNYFTAKNAVEDMGYYIGEYLKSLVKYSNLNLSRTRIVGHSLGAHIAGIAGAAVGGKLDHIVGLDPAWPLFHLKYIDNRLDKTDANYVQVIHTSGGVLGFPVSIGHADFYPNGGKKQPGCHFFDITGMCAHSRSYHYYAESLRGAQFLATRCDTYKNFRKGKCTNSASTYMGGYYLDKRASGNYYLRTSGKSPFNNMK